MMIGTLIFCAILASSIGIGAGIVACCSGMVYRRHRAEKASELAQQMATHALTAGRERIEFDSFPGREMRALHREGRESPVCPEGAV